MAINCTVSVTIVRALKWVEHGGKHDTIKMAFFKVTQPARLEDRIVDTRIIFTWSLENWVFRCTVH
jgi:hypothetical protein